MGCRIVVADRSPSALKAAELALPAPEFEVSIFADGQEALRAISEMGPDAVLLGLSLPSRDGYEIADFVKAQPHGPQVAVFFLRGPFEPFDEAKAAPLDHDGIVSKPFDGESLLRLVRKAIDRRKEIPLPEEPVRVKPDPPLGGAPDARSAGATGSREPRSAGGPGSREPAAGAVGDAAGGPGARNARATGSREPRSVGGPDPRGSGGEGVVLTAEIEAKVREIVRSELGLARADAAAMARDAVMVEVKRVLVDELGKIGTKKF